MGQKVNPIGLRVGIIRDWESRWYADQEFGDLLIEDVKIREYLFKELHEAFVSRIEIERSKNKVEVIIRSARPGVVIGQSGENVEKLKKAIEKITGDKQIYIKVVEIGNPDLDATLVARSIAEQLEQRASFRVAQKRAIQRVMRAGAKGIKTQVSGRLGGAEIARTEWYREGRVPLHTLRADIDYATVRAETTYGTIGVKVWIFRGEILGGMKQVMNPAPAEERPAKRGRGRGEGQERRGRRNDRAADKGE